MWAKIPPYIRDVASSHSICQQLQTSMEYFRRVSLDEEAAKPIKFNCLSGCCGVVLDRNCLSIVAVKLGRSSLCEGNPRSPCTICWRPLKKSTN